MNVCRFCLFDWCVHIFFSLSRCNNNNITCCNAAYAFNTICNTNIQMLIVLFRMKKPNTRRIKLFPLHKRHREIPIEQMPNAEIQIRHSMLHTHCMKMAIICITNQRHSHNKCIKYNYKIWWHANSSEHRPKKIPPKKNEGSVEKILMIFVGYAINAELKACM